MNRLLLTVAVVSSWSSLLLIDSAIKGGAILLLAACIAALLRRDSAATRHLVWLVAIVAVLIVPVLSASLPHWHVLPEWAVIPSVPAGQVRSSGFEDKDNVESSLLVQRDQSVSTAAMHQSAIVESTTKVADVPRHSKEIESSAISVQSTTPAIQIATPAWGWANALSALWLLGVSVLMLRLAAARLVLWSNESRSDVIAVSTATSDRFFVKNDAVDQSLVSVFEDAVRQLQIRQHVCLMMQPQRSIPIVWGLWKFRLLLPETARGWSNEQQKSVLLHELAHIKRRDTLSQLLSQLACAIYWFNPLVWFAAWRLHVERERACDDLVLCNGVAASVYAEHLLNVASRLTSSPWTQACGLAMARRSSLECRLTAVLNQQRNRRTVTGVIVVASLLFGGAITAPIAMSRAAENTVPAEDPEPEPEPEEDTEDMAEDGDKIQPKQSPAADTASVAPASETPKQFGPSDWAGWFLNQVQFRKQPDGTFPPVTFKHLRAQVVADLKAGANAEGAPVAREWLETTAAQRNWTKAELKFQVEQIAAWKLTAVQQAMSKEEFAAKFHPQQGKTITVDALKMLSFGPASENGLRVAWSFEPSKKEYSVGDSLRCRVIVHNSGDQPVQFFGQDIHDGKWSVVNASGSPFDAQPLPYSNVWLHPELFPYQRYRLQPGQVVELGGQGVGIGEGDHSAAKTQIAIWRVIKAQPGDAVRIRVETEFGLSQNPSSQYILQSQDEFPEEQSRDWSGTLRSGEVSFQVVAATGHDPTEPQPQSSKPTAGLKLPADTEKILRWGKPVNGLRAALSRLRSLGVPKTGYVDFDLVVQNVSSAPIRLMANATAPDTRRIRIRKDGVTQQGLRSSNPSGVDYILQPREVAVLRAFLNNGGIQSKIKGRSFADETEFTFIGQLEIVKAPEEAWSGNLLTPDVSGAVILGKQQPDQEKAAADEHSELHQSAIEKSAVAKPKASRKGPVRSANGSGRYSLNKDRTLVMCRPTSNPPWLSVSWPASTSWPKSRLRIEPKLRVENYRNWVAVWEPDADDIWFVDDHDLTRVNISNPAEALVTRQGHKANAVLEFNIPDIVRTEFARLGFQIGSYKSSINVTDGQEMLTAEILKEFQIGGTVTGPNGQLMADVPIHVRTALSPTVDIATTKTDKNGKYKAKFRLDLRTVARYRGILVQPVLDGFTEREFETSGMFEALLRPDEQPQRVVIRNYPPMWLTGVRAGENETGPIRRFSDRDLIIGQSAVADFTMLPASTITGTLVDLAGKPLTGHFVSVSAPDAVVPKGYETIAHTETDAEGRFTLKNIPASEILNFEVTSPWKDGNRTHQESATKIFGPASTYRIRIETDHGETRKFLKIDRLPTEKR